MTNNIKYPKPIKRIKKIKRIKRLKKTPMATLERKAWKVFSIWIRDRDTRDNSLIKCYTCSAWMSFKEAEAGHFIPRGRKIVKFDEMNVHSQCVRCNHFLSGNLVKYTMQMIEQYGREAVSQLIMKEQFTHKFTREKLEEIIKKYTLER